eukprot:364979-Chlamydomonas_euryale.AAC.8
MSGRKAVGPWGGAERKVRRDGVTVVEEPSVCAEREAKRKIRRDGVMVKGQRKVNRDKGTMEERQRWRGIGR